MISLAYAASDGADGHGGSIFSDPTFWVAIAFIIVVGFVVYKVKGTVAAALDKKGEDIKAKLEEAKTLREDAQKMLADYKRKQAEAEKEAEDIVAHAMAEAERLAKKAEEDLAASIARREKQATDRIAQAEAQALAEVRRKAVDVATMAAGAILVTSMGEDDKNRLVDQAIADLPTKLH
ncbi:MAG: F0F1 ATP synthase subunit B [Rhodospirillaceae bacterium]